MSGPTTIPAQPAVVGALTDGTGISAITKSKFFKDFVVDMLLSASAALVAIQVTDVGTAIADPKITAFAVIGAGVRVVYRAILRWGTTP